MFSELVTGNYFSTLGLTPARGRFFSPEEDSVQAAHPVAVMNYGIWQLALWRRERHCGQEAAAQ